MADRLYVRQITESHYQWRKLGSDDQWHDEVHAGTLALLQETIEQSNDAVNLLLPGQNVVWRNMPVDGVEKKHLAKLLPYEMEEHLIDPVEDLHFAFGPIVDGHVDVMYCDLDDMQANMDAMASIHCDLFGVHPEYTMLDVDKFDGVLILDGDIVIGKFGNAYGFSAEINIAPFVLEGLLEALGREDIYLRLVADSVENVAILKSSLPDHIVENENSYFDEQLGSYWDYVTNTPSLPINLRSGPFARQLPIKQWWMSWQVTTYVAAAAFVLALVVNITDYRIAKSESIEIRKETQVIFKQAVPNGRGGDEVKKLKNLLDGDGNSGSGEPTNFVSMLGGISKTIKDQSDVKISNFRYSGDQRELRLSIEVNGLSELGKFRELLAVNGLETDSPRTTKQGEIYQATMKVTEKQ